MITRVNAAVSSSTITDTDAPQESVLSPNVGQAHVKCTDDMVIVGQKVTDAFRTCWRMAEVKDIVKLKQEDFRAWLAWGSAEPPDRYHLTRRAGATTITEGKNADV